MSVIENPYAPPQADLGTPSSACQTTFFVVAPRKLVLMVLLSQGMYSFYWLYKHWACYRQATGAKVLPLVRAFFSVFFFYSLVMKISQKLALDGVSYRWWPRSLALGLIICAFLPYTYIWFVTSLTTLKLSICLMILQVSLAAQVQGAVNQVEGDPNGKANIRLTWANGIWIMIGLGLWSLGFMSAFLEQGLS
ncbi:hypothetical protein [Pseudomonas sp. 22 E 5]|uniref:hypothetical protein n=1 Tax=unclassified Pseudomonas TaxID=196821 RepID=UPI000812594F|nr:MULTISPECIES: hypothetical protein [unclassified Pseudomonas]CRM05901.1 hypothetical protein [Pseudomonas sp. 31 E 6]CRM09311.1 hypothetical protein [Pseudomonas sp. 31 E 5]CRM94553.1 hypothetical protein [Pseudomonas sp. 22 E 5]